MDIKVALNDSLSYTKEALWGQWKRWVILFIMSVIFPCILGYMMEIYRGSVPAPKPENWGRLFIDGLKFLLVGIIYSIPVLIILIVSFFPIMMNIITQVSAGGEFTLTPANLIPYLIPITGGVILSVILGIIITLISTIGIVRMARIGGISEAFNFGAILDTIRSIGWVSYIIALIVLTIVVIAITLAFSIFEMIPYIGFLIGTFFGVLLTVFESRYLTLLYESAEQ
jgi:hypothetical protein